MQASLTTSIAARRGVALRAQVCSDGDSEVPIVERSLDLCMSWCINCV